MDKQQYLLTCLMEECSELSMECAKAIRFGLDDLNPHTGRTNLEGILSGYSDVIGVMETLVDSGNIVPLGATEQQKLVSAKLVKVGHYLGISKSLGRVE